MAVRIIAIAAALSVVACGSRSGSPSADSGGSHAEGGVLDCAWVSASNCWKTAIATAASCLPPGGQQGTISADGKACTYASGTVVSFASPIWGGSIPGFTVTSGGKTCLEAAPVSEVPGLVASSGGGER